RVAPAATVAAAAYPSVPSASAAPTCKMPPFTATWPLVPWLFGPLAVAPRTNVPAPALVSGASFTEEELKGEAVRVRVRPAVVTSIVPPLPLIPTPLTESGRTTRLVEPSVAVL